MLFKSITVFRLEPTWKFTAEQLEAELGSLKFQPCGQTQAKSSGWACPKDERLVYSYNEQLMLKLQVEKKNLTGGAIRKEVTVRAKALEETQGFKPGRAKLKELREQVTTELLAKAATSDRATFVWIDPKNRLLVIDGVKSKADEVIEALRVSLKALPLSPIRTVQTAYSGMTEWLASGNPPDLITIDRDCELKTTTEERSSVKYSRHNLEGDDIRAHIASGKKVTSLSMTFNNRVSFVLTDNFAIKRIGMLDIAAETTANQEGQDDAFDADFFIVTSELTALINHLIGSLGGEVKED